MTPNPAVLHARLTTLAATSPLGSQGQRMLVGGAHGIATRNADADDARAPRSEDDE